jgi:hypothetical protein
MNLAQGKSNLAEKFRDVLQPLCEMIETWAPQRACARDPIVAIAYAWESIVGEDLSQKARPSRLDGATLHVMTISGAWSQQLAFLEPQILSALRRLPEIKSIERLRFRVGRLRACGTSPKIRHSDPALQVRARTDDIPPTGMTALERLRLHCARLRRDAHGLCEGCGASMPGEGPRCAPCAYVERRERSERVQRIMYETPPLRSADLRSMSTKRYVEPCCAAGEKYWIAPSARASFGPTDSSGV